MGLLQPATHRLYNIELGADMVRKPKDGEVEEFHLWWVEETVVALKQGLFKRNNAVAWIDFLIRHGYVNARNEPGYLELVSRIHRRTHFKNTTFSYAFRLIFPGSSRCPFPKMHNL